MIQSPKQLIARTILVDQVHGEKKYIPYKNQDWQKITSKIDFVKTENLRWVSLGSSSTRERLFFDDNSPKMMALKQTARKACQGKSIGNILIIVNKIINDLTAVPGKSRNEIEKGLDAKLDNLIKSKKLSSSNKIIDIHMDELIDRKLLVCRHKGLLATSILADLVKQKILPPGKVRQYRSSIVKNNKETGAHCWSVYRDEVTGHLWMCDPRWETARNLNTDFNQLAKKYGEITLAAMVNRMDSEDGLLPFIQKINAIKSYFPLVQDAILSEGTANSKGQQIRIEMEKEDHTYKALCYALLKNGIKFEEKNHPNPFIIIRSENNPRIFSVDFFKLYKDFKYQLKELQSTLTPFIHRLNELKFFPLTKDAYLSSGTDKMPGKQIRLELDKEDAAFKAACYALDKQNIAYQVCYHPNPFIVIHEDQGDKLSKLDFNKLIDDYFFKRKPHAAIKNMR